MLSPLRFLIASGLKDAGFNSTILSPILNIFTLLDSELNMMSFQPSPELEKEFLKLEQGILLANEDLSTDEGAEDLGDDEDDFDDDDDDIWNDDDDEDKEDDPDYS